MQRLSYPTETVLSNKIIRNELVPSFKDSHRKPLVRGPPVHPLNSYGHVSRIAHLRTCTCHFNAASLYREKHAPQQHDNSVKFHGKFIDTVLS